MWKRLAGTLRLLVVGSGIGILLACLLLIVLQVRLILPAVATRGYSNPLPTGVEELYLDTADGEKLHVWHHPSNARFEGRARAMLFFSGNGDTLGSIFGDLDQFQPLGFSTFGFEYRGTGLSSGWPSEEGLYQDVRTVADYVKKSFAPEDTVLIGRSFGTGLAAYLSQSFPESTLILISPYLSIPDVVSDREWLWLLRPFVRIEIPSKKFLPKSKSECIFITHGTADGVINYHHSQALSTLVPASARFQFFTVPGASHWSIFGDSFKTIEQFLRQCYQGGR